MVDGMSDDRELLQLAAKAAGLFDEWPAPDYEVQWNGNGLWCSGMGKGILWNPHTDDGGALRLAAKLEIRVSVSGMKAIADWWQRPAMTELNCEVVAIDGDPCAALRRVIVCSAAEIEKAMPA